MFLDRGPKHANDAGMVMRCRHLSRQMSDNVNASVGMVIGRGLIRQMKACFLAEGR